MKVTPLEIKGPLLVELNCFQDQQGFFIERFHTEKLKTLGLDIECVQINHSQSAPGVLRGLHYQFSPPQGKLIGVTRGKIWDVAVDIRPNSPTFGRSVSVEISADNNRLLWIPPGFAHGFVVLGAEVTDVLYVVSAAYHAKSEGGIRWDDLDLSIAWPKTDRLVVSDRDQNLPSFKDYQKLNIGTEFIK